MKVDTTHSQHTRLKGAWDMCNDFVAGTRAVKAKGEKYLPKPNPDDKSKESEARYKNYLERAVFYEFSSKIINQYLGLAFKQDPTFEVDVRLENLKKNVDGLGTSLYQLAQKGFKALMINARFGIWVDYPKVERVLSQKEQSELNLLPKMIFYSADSIINWRVGVINNKNLPILIVLKETAEEVDAEDYFKTEEVEQWRELGLDEVGYYVTVWRKNKDGEFYPFIPKQYPLNSNNQYWSFIPFQIFGSQYNTFEEQEIPIEPLVHIEKGIYCNSADAENSRFFCGQVQPYMNIDDQTRAFYEKRNENGQVTGEVNFRLGSETVAILGENGTFGFAVAPPNTMSTDGIKEKREIISELGFQLGQGGSAIKTATQADNEAQAQHSQASLCVANLNEGFLNALLWCNDYMGVQTEPKFIIRQDFAPINIDVGVLNTLNALVDGGKLPKSVIFDKAKQFNLLNPELTNDEIEGMIEAEAPDLGLDDER